MFLKTRDLKGRTTILKGKPQFCQILNCIFINCVLKSRFFKLHILKLLSQTDHLSLSPHTHASKTAILNLAGLQWCLKLTIYVSLEQTSTKKDGTSPAVMVSSPWYNASMTLKRIQEELWKYMFMEIYTRKKLCFAQLIDT